MFLGCFLDELDTCPICTMCLLSCLWYSIVEWCSYVSTGLPWAERIPLIPAHAALDYALCTNVSAIPNSVVALIPRITLQGFTHTWLPTPFIDLYKSTAKIILHVIHPTDENLLGPTLEIFEELYSIMIHINIILDYFTHFYNLGHREYFYII